ncbi:MAG: hypothetical protein RLZZ118_21 [Bacteroidota bacterium]|jgi:multidrug resistance efflux pump
MKTKNNIALKSFESIYYYNRVSKIKFWFWGIIAALALILFLPWTQNIKTKGNITSLYQEQRPQDINSPIPGKIAKWWVKEGDIVKKGDTILQISEIKEDYLDPMLVNRTQLQLDAKVGTINNYEGKIASVESQMVALENAKQLKTSQLENKLIQLNSKLVSEQAELQAAQNELTLSKDQFERQQKMFDEGLVSQTQLQQRNISYQNALSKKIIVENKIAQTKQELLNNKIEQNSVEQDYSEKIAKAQGDKFQSLSQINSGQGEVAKLQNQVSNYIIRNNMYIILAPQDGQIIQAKRSGIGEVIKDGERLMTIVPTKVNYAVEMFVKPVDLPLIQVGHKVRFVFDGYPAIVFSGWPKNSYGTFGGTIIAYESRISPNGLFRVLVVEDTTDRKWPEQINIGTGAQGISLLKNVPIWYELWRNINGFPPDFYISKEEEKNKK